MFLIILQNRYLNDETSYVRYNYLNINFVKSYPNRVVQRGKKYNSVL